MLELLNKQANYSEVTSPQPHRASVHNLTNFEKGEDITDFVTHLNENLLNSKEEPKIQGILNHKKFPGGWKK
jgi:hypothetical protein